MTPSKPMEALVGVPALDDVAGLLVGAAEAIGDLVRHRPPGECFKDRETRS